MTNKINIDFMDEMDFIEDEIWNKRDILTYDDYCKSTDKRKIYDRSGKTKLTHPYSDNREEYIEFCINYNLQYK